MNSWGAGILMACMLGLGPVAGLARAAAPPPPPQICDIDGTAVQPANPASTAGKSGVLRCKDPASGRLLRESTYDSGQELGLARSFHPDGRLKRAAYRTEPGGERAVAEFSTRGQLTFLRCADKPMLQPVVEDRRLCGFDKAASTVELFDDKGVLRSRLVYLHGRRLRAESLYDNGKVAAQEELAGNQRVERQFSSAGIKRRESVWLLQERGRTVRQRVLEYSERGALLREQRWDASGEPLRDDSYFASNGQPKSKQNFSGSGDRRVADVVEFHENGQRAAQGRFLAPARAPLLPVGTHCRFNEQGTMVAELNYDDKGRLIQERSWDDSGRLLREEPAPGDAASKLPSQ
ncbi:toxin-antitoxin system YwqK family antitoxin [Variovorax sp. LARHSF232]